MTEWAKNLAKTLIGLSQDQMESILLKNALPKLWKDYPEKRMEGNLFFSQEELYFLHKKIEKYSMPEPMSGCWLWLAGADYDGYGATGFGKKQVRAHRASYIVFKGDIPEGMSVCHTCDNPSCVNPDHLWLGTTRQNQVDVSKKHRRHGEASGTAKYNNHVVLNLRNEYSEGKKPRELSRMFGIPRSTVQKIIYRKTWNHI